MQTLLRVERLEVTYEGGFRALDGVSLEVFPGEVRVLLGPNGAGKTTLLDAITGRVRPSQGAVWFRGQEITRWPEHAIAGRGIARKFQTPGVLEGLTVEENLRLAVQRRKGLLASFRGALPSQERALLEEALALSGLAAKRDQRVSALSHGERQWLELAMVLATGAELVLLDEPTAGMTRSETEAVARLLRDLRGQRAFLVVEHDMAFVEALEAPVTLLHQGRVLREGSLEELRADPEVRAVYLGGGVHA
ncbi:urea ABC transporter ATP-binding protein UrtD [Thermus thalpophilus]